MGRVWNRAVEGKAEGKGWDWVPWLCRTREVSIRGVTEILSQLIDYHIIMRVHAAKLRAFKRKNRILGFRVSSLSVKC